MEVSLETKILSANIKLNDEEIRNFKIVLSWAKNYATPYTHMMSFISQLETKLR